MSKFSRGLVLRSLDYGEADRIITFFTDDRGKLSVFARGARRSKLRFTSALEPFAIVRLHASSPSRGELWTLQEAHMVRPFRGILGDLKKMIGVGRALDFVRQLLPWH